MPLLNGQFVPRKHCYSKTCTHGQSRASAQSCGSNLHRIFRALSIMMCQWKQVTVFLMFCQKAPA
eukprot:3937379-Rhodomonas_salina.2